MKRTERKRLETLMVDRGEAGEVSSRSGREAHPGRGDEDEEAREGAGMSGVEIAHSRLGEKEAEEGEVEREAERRAVWLAISADLQVIEAVWLVERGC